MSYPSLALTDAVARSVSRCGATGLPTLSFVVDGVVVRYRLSEACAAFLAGGLTDQGIVVRSRSDRSSDNPASDVSTPLEGVKV